MRRFAQFDVLDRWKRPASPLLRQIAFGVVCTLGLWVARLFIDVVAPAAGPFALIYPAAMIATLYGRWPAGLVTYAAGLLYIVWAILPPAHSFALAFPADGPRIVVNGISLLAVIAFAESFRSHGRVAMSQRNAEIAKRDMLLKEIDHRTKNNFAIVVSLLRVQKDSETSQAARDALDVAANRVLSFATAHESLYDDGSDVEDMNMRTYLTKLITSICKATFLNNSVQLNLTIDDLRLPRDQAVAIGLVANEAITNAAKHAFDSNDGGVLDVNFHSLPQGWQLTVTDNGSGVNGSPVYSSGLGSSLIEAFATQAAGTYMIEPLVKGTRVRLVAASVHMNGTMPG
ncbi:MAG: sensor histidine kinase [Novosphingobium sp.]